MVTKVLKEPLFALDPDHIASHNSLVVLPPPAQAAAVLHFPLIRSIMMNMYTHTFFSAITSTLRIYAAVCQEYHTLLILASL